MQPASPGQLALVGLMFSIGGLLFPGLGVLGFVGLLIFVFAGLSYLIRPRLHEQYWRGRRIDAGRPSPAAERFYRMIYRR